jgi:MYXO-CTERM domain-containing protein
MRRTFRPVAPVALSLWCLLACSAHPDAHSDAVASRTEPNLFGDDDRRDWYAHPDDAMKTIARESVVAVIRRDRVDVTDPDDVKISSRGTHQDVHALCPGETFADQPVSASCSGVLIDDDLVLTAGHCLDAGGDCDSVAFVFDWLYEEEGELATITTEDVYYCLHKVVHDLAAGIDHAVIQLDRPVAAPRRPRPVRYEDTELALETPVAVIGFGAGIPLKIDTGGRVVNNVETRYFESTADTFGGSSGAGVLDHDGQVIGVHVRGPTDYRTEGDCSVVARVADDGSRGGDESHMARVLEDTCVDAAWDTPLCGTAASLCTTEGTCPAGADLLPLDPLTGWCATPCVASEACDDGLECRDGLCQPAPSCFAGAVWARDPCGRPTSLDTECARDEICVDEGCEPARPGDTCGLAIPLEATGTIRLAERFDPGYRGLYRGSCGAIGCDVVYTFELPTRTTIQGRVQGNGMRVYLRTSCDDAASEVTCRREDGARFTHELEPGTHFMFLDTERPETVDWSLDLTFTPHVAPADGGHRDAGPADDAGMDGTPKDTRSEGCGCSGAPHRATWWWAALLGWLLVRRRRPA